MKRTVQGLPPVACSSPVARSHGQSAAHRRAGRARGPWNTEDGAKPRPQDMPRKPLDRTSRCARTIRPRSSRVMCRGGIRAHRSDRDDGAFDGSAGESPGGPRRAREGAAGGNADTSNRWPISCGLCLVGTYPPAPASRWPARRHGSILDVSLMPTLAVDA